MPQVHTRSRDTEIVRTTSWSAGPGVMVRAESRHSQDGKLVKIEGDPDHPWNQGRICARCSAMTQYVYHPDRLTKPLKRVGERGEGKWEEISWDEALDLIEEKLGKIREDFGPESVIFSMGTGRDIGAWICMLAYAYGSPNVMFAMSGNACYSPRIAAVETVLGDYCVPDALAVAARPLRRSAVRGPGVSRDLGLQHPQYLSRQHLRTLVRRSHEEGHQDHLYRSQNVVVRPPSEHWLRLRAGTDGALAMGFLNVILNEDLYDHELRREVDKRPVPDQNRHHGKLLRASELAERGLRKTLSSGTVKRENRWCGIQRRMLPQSTAAWRRANSWQVRLLDGEKVRCRTVWDVFWRTGRPNTPSRVAEITGVPEEDIAAAARFFAKSKPAAIHWGLPIDSTPGITPTAMAITDLWCLTGNLEIPGGNIIARHAFEAVAYALPGAEGAIKLACRKSTSSVSARTSTAPSSSSSGGRKPTRYSSRYFPGIRIPSRDSGCRRAT